MSSVALLSETLLDVEAGGSTDLTITVHNTSAIVDQFRFEVLGEATAWAVVSPAVVGIFPGADAEVQVHFSAPRSPGISLDEVPFAVKVTSDGDPAGTVVEEGVLRIGSFREVSASLKPRKVTARRTARFELILDNRATGPPRRRWPRATRRWDVTVQNTSSPSTTVTVTEICAPLPPTTPTSLA